jgi:hypothetical protein
MSRHRIIESVRGQVAAITDTTATYRAGKRAPFDVESAVRHLESLRERGEVLSCSRDR